MRVHPINENIDIVGPVIQVNQSGNSEEDMITETDSDVDYDNLCIICLENFMHKQISLPCNHIFHIPCIIKWGHHQIKEKRTTRCPICKIAYDFKEFTNKIFLIYINTINSIINKLDLLLTKGNISRQQKLHIIKQKKEYKDVLNLFKNVKNFSISKLLIYEIQPLPENIACLVHRTELQIAIAKDEYTDNLLPPKHFLNRYKICISLKQNAIVKYFLNIFNSS